MLNEQELETLVMARAAGAAVNGGPSSSFTQAEVELIADWAEGAKIDHGILQNILSGNAVIVSFSPGDGPTIQLTEKGKAAAEALLAGTVG